MTQTPSSSAEADLSPVDPEQVLPVEPAFPDARTVVQATRGVVLGPDVRFTTPDGVWARVETMPLATGVAFQVVCEHDPAAGGTVFAPYAAVAAVQPAAEDVARALRVSGLAALDAVADRAASGDLAGVSDDVTALARPELAGVLRILLESGVGERTLWTWLLSGTALLSGEVPARVAQRDRRRAEKAAERFVAARRSAA